MTQVRRNSSHNKAAANVLSTFTVEGRRPHISSIVLAILFFFFSFLILHRLAGETLLLNTTCVQGRFYKGTFVKLMRKHC